MLWTKVPESKEKLKTKQAGYDASTEVGQSWEKGKRFMTRKGVQEQKLGTILVMHVFTLVAEKVMELKEEARLQIRNRKPEIQQGVV